MSDSLLPFEDFPDFENTVDLKERPDMQWHIQSQIHRCLSTLSGQDSSIFEANVRGFMKILPKKIYDQVMSRDDEYNDTIENWNYQYCCGIKMGTPNNPIKNPKAGEVISPLKSSETVTDYEALLRVVIDCLESSQMIYKIQQMTRIHVPKKRQLIYDTAPQTPTFKKKKQKTDSDVPVVVTG